MKFPRIGFGHDGCGLGLCLVAAPWLIVALIALACCSAAACTRRAAELYSQPPMQGPEAPLDETPSQKVHRLEGELAAAREDLRYDNDKWVRLVTNVSAAGCALGCVACFIACIFLPVMKKRLMILGAAFGAGVAVAVALREAAPYLPWIGLGIIAIGVGATLPTFIAHAKKAAE